MNVKKKKLSRSHCRGLIAAMITGCGSGAKVNRQTLRCQETKKRRLRSIGLTLQLQQQDVWQSTF